MPKVAMVSMTWALLTLAASTACQESKDWSCFALGEEKKYWWVWKKKGGKKWLTESGFSLRWPAERNLISFYISHCPSIKRTHVGRSEGEEQNKFKSALHFCIKWLWQSIYSLGKLVLLHQWFLCPLSCKQTPCLLWGSFCLKMQWFLNKIQCPIVSSSWLSSTVRLFALNLRTI